MSNVTTSIASLPGIPWSPAAPAAQAPAPAPPSAAEIQSEARDAIRQQMREQRDALREQIRAQIEAARAQRQAAPGSTVMPPFPGMPPFASGGPPASDVILILGFFIATAFTIVFLPLARAFARRVDRRSVTPNEHPDTTARLERIEQAVEAISIEVERISEGQRFTNQVMAEVRSLPAGGAPAEPIRVREREGLGRT